MTDNKEGPNVYTERQKMMTFRVVDPFGYLVFQIQANVPESMITNVQEDWVNLLDLKTKYNPHVPYRIEVVFK